MATHHHAVGARVSASIDHGSFASNHHQFFIYYFVVAPARVDSDSDAVNLRPSLVRAHTSTRPNVRTIIITMRPTADLDGACARLKRALHRARFHALSPSRAAGTRIDTDLKRGDGRLFVRVLRHALCARSRAVARVIADRGHDLAGVESPLRFVERAFRATIDVFGYKPRASAAQFASSSGFAVVKMTTVLDVLAHVEAMEVEMMRASERRRGGNRRRSVRGVMTPLEREARGETRRDAAARETRRRRRRERWNDENDDDDENDENDDDAKRFARTVFVNPEYVEYVVDGRGERSREREEESSAVASLRVELAEALGRLTRAESELAAVAARCDALERVREEDGDEDAGARGGAERDGGRARGVAARRLDAVERIHRRFYRAVRRKVARGVETRRGR